MRRAAAPRHAVPSGLVEALEDEWVDVKLRRFNLVTKGNLRAARCVRGFVAVLAVHHHHRLLERLLERLLDARQRRYDRIEPDLE
jgi:hypothetical protein